MALFSGIKEKLSEYVDTRLRLYQISIEEKAVELVSSLSLFAVLLCTALLALLFSLVFVAKLINHFVGYDFVGYGIIAVICIFILVLMIRKQSQHYFVERIKGIITENIKNKKDDGKDVGSI